jgi:hypothetical protein
MKRLVLVSTAVAALAAIVTTTAFAKGASEAMLTGPGLGGGIRLSGEGQAGGDELMQLAEEAGFFPSVFATSPDPMLSSRPAGDLGPRYTITYTMPGPNGTVSELRQELYPFAKPSPVSHMEPDQRYFGTEKTVGGWYVASTALKHELLAAGLPASPPADGGGSRGAWTVVGVLGAALATLVAVVLARRRPAARRHATT